MPARARIEDIVTSREPAIVRAATAFAAGCVASGALYSLLRIVQSFLFKEANPALVFYSEHAGYFWRVWIVAYAGGMCALIAWLADTKRTAAVLGRVITPIAILVFVQAMFVP